MKTRTLTLLVILTQLTAALPARAEDQRQPGAPLVALGSRIRIVAPGFVDGRVQGSLEAIDDETVTVRVEGASPLVIPRAAIERLEMGLGRRKSRLLGATVGIVAGLALGAVMPVDPENCGTATVYQSTYVADVDSGNFCSRGEALGAGALGLGLVGLAIGIPTERWGTVRVGEAHIGVQPRRDGFGATLQFRF